MIPAEYTDQEKLVAQCLDELGLRYEWQASFDKYLLDFYVQELNIAIEADGPYGHLRKHDRERDRWLIDHCEIRKVVHIKETSKDEIRANLAKLITEE